MRWPVFALAGLAACPRPAALAPEATLVDETSVSGARIHWYDVTGNDVRSLRDGLRAHAPHDENGEAVIGQTEWQASWTWSGDGEPCRVATAEVTLQLEVWLPRWVPGPGTDPAIVENWRVYLAALARHERGHVELVAAETGALPAILRAAACTDVDAVGHDALDAIRALNHEYDARTQHGKLQGAVFWTAEAWGASLDDRAGFAE